MYKHIGLKYGWEGWGIDGTQFECEMLGKGYLSPWASSSLQGSSLLFLSDELLRP